MKKMKLLLGMLVVALTFGMTVTSCEEDDDTGGETFSGKTIVVTGIPASGTNGAYVYGIIALMDADNSDIVAATADVLPIQITSGKLTANLYEIDYDTYTTSKPFTDSGIYRVLIILSSDSSSSSPSSYFGSITKSITNKVTTIPFSEFK